VVQRLVRRTLLRALAALRSARARQRRAPRLARRVVVCTSRCSARSSLPPDQVYADYGFRVAVG
jgi:hypothetical protein